MVRVGSSMCLHRGSGTVMECKVDGVFVGSDGWDSTASIHGYRMSTVCVEPRSAVLGPSSRYGLYDKLSTN